MKIELDDKQKKKFDDFVTDFYLQKPKLQKQVLIAMEKIISVALKQKAFPELLENQVDVARFDIRIQYKKNEDKVFSYGCKGHGGVIFLKLSGLIDYVYEVPGKYTYSGKIQYFPTDDFVVKPFSFTRYDENGETLDVYNINGENLLKTLYDRKIYHMVVRFTDFSLFKYLYLNLNKKSSISINSQGEEVLDYKAEIEYNSRTIFLHINNKTYQITTTTAFSENDEVIKALYVMPNKFVSKSNLDQSKGEGYDNKKLKKDLHKIIENLGFVGILKELFFDVSLEKVVFKNPVEINELQYKTLLKFLKSRKNKRKS